MFSSNRKVLSSHILFWMWCKNGDYSYFLFLWWFPPQLEGRIHFQFPWIFTSLSITIVECQNWKTLLTKKHLDFHTAHFLQEDDEHQMNSYKAEFSFSMWETCSGKSTRPPILLDKIEARKYIVALWGAKHSASCGRIFWGDSIFCLWCVKSSRRWYVQLYDAKKALVDIISCF